MSTPSGSEPLAVPGPDLGPTGLRPQVERAPTVQPVVQRVRRPVAGAIAGFFFFLFLTTTLVLFGALPIGKPITSLLPILGIVVGAAWGWWSPLGHKDAPRPAG